MTRRTTLLAKRPTGGGPTDTDLKAGSTGGYAAPEKPTVAVAAPRRRSPNRLWLVAGATLTLLSALGASTLYATATSRVEVIAAAADIELGDPLNADDLVVVEVLPETAATALTLADYLEAPDRYLGRELARSLEAGAILQREALFVEVVEDPYVVIGADLSPGQYPMPGLTPGDRVSVIVLATTDDRDELRAEEFTHADVVDVATLKSVGDADIFISLEVRQSEAPAVSAALAQERVRLALIDDLSGVDR